MRGDGGNHSRRVRFYPFELDLGTGELCKHRQRIRLQRQPFQILSALLAKPGEIVSREELCELLWPGYVFLDYEHGLNRSVNKLRRALADNAGKPRYIETVHGRGYRFIAAVDDGSVPREARLAVLPVENITGSPENDDLADGITEAMIDGLGNTLRPRLCVIALVSVLRYKNRRTTVTVDKVAAELRADYLVCGRLRGADGRFLLRVELVDSRDHALRWAESFEFAQSSLGAVREEICSRFAVSVELELLPPSDLALEPVSG